MSRLKEKYQKEIVASIAQEFDIGNELAVPKVQKVVLNSGIGDAIKNKEVVESIRKDLAVITGQIPSIQKARVSVASFGVRKGMPVGLRVTLRNERMYNFLDKLFSIVLPRLRDFKGVPLDAFDGKGNYTLGMEEHTVFPEIDLSKVGKPFGLEVTIVTSAKRDEIARRLLELMGMPFEKKKIE